MAMDFARDLIKGRIAETVFEMMFRETEKFTVLRFGYESTLPQLAQCQKAIYWQSVIDQVRGNPDFVLITQDKKQAYFVEVKFRSHINEDSVREIAEKAAHRWELSFIFLITPEGFFFSPVRRILQKEGVIQKLEDDWVSAELREKYFELVKEFLC